MISYANEMPFSINIEENPCSQMAWRNSIAPGTVG